MILVKTVNDRNAPSCSCSRMDSRILFAIRKEAKNCQTPLIQTKGLPAEIL
jgi:hypothetical protein